MTFKKAEIEKTFRNGLDISETHPLNSWILHISWGWHCTSLKKTAVKLAQGKVEQRKGLWYLLHEINVSSQ
jgi:hypothetical protein